MAILEATQLAKGFDGKQVLVDVSLEVPSGAVTVVIGPSGAGKTTLLRCLSLLDSPDSGRIVFREAEVWPCLSGGNTQQREFRRRVGLVFQHLNLWPHLTVCENVSLPLRLAGSLSREEAADRGIEWLKRVQIEGLGKRYPSEISGGERQRAAIARAMALEPEVLCLDEITSALDPENVSLIRDVINRVVDQGVAVLLVTHHIGFARAVANEIAFPDRGAVSASGSVHDVLDTTANTRVREFIDRIECRI